jgi:AAHS family 3-hydroxyphenylpropionic acid transporter
MALIDGADAQSFSIAAPLISKALAIPSAGLGLLFSVTALGGAVGYLAGGLLSDRWGAKSVVVAGAAVIGLFQLATAYANDAVLLIAIRFFVGLALGAVVPGLVKIISQVAPVSLAHRMQGLFWACFPVGVLSGGIINGWILEHSRWQTIFFVGGIAPLVVAALLWGFVPRSVARQVLPRPEAATPGALTDRRLWLRVLFTALVFFFTNGATSVAMNWTPTLLVHSGYLPAAGAHALAWQAAGALISMTATGFIVERYELAPIVFGLIVATIGLVLFSILIHSPHAVPILMVVVGATLALSGTAAAFWAGKLFPGDHQASGLGGCMAIGRIGQMVFPGLIGLSLQAGGSPSETLLLCAALPAIGALAAFALALLSRPTT